MKTLRILLLAALLCGATAARAQDVARVRAALTSMREAFDGGNWRTAITKATELETLIGSTTKPATAYIKIISYSKLGDLENCVRSGNAYLNGGEAINDETLAEVRRVVADAQRTLAAREEERRRVEAHNKAATDEWARISESTDLAVLSAFISKYGDTQHRAAAQARYDDEKAWQTAVQSRTVQGYEAYLGGNTAKRYAQQARDVLEEAYPRLALEAAAKGDINSMINMNNSYGAMFPQGSRREELRTAMAKTFYERGMALSKNRNSLDDMRQSVDLLERARGLSNYDVAGTIRTTNRRITDLARGDGGLIGFAADQQTYIGLSFAGLNRRKLGWYFTIKASPDVFKSTDYNDLKELEDGSIDWRAEGTTHYTLRDVEFVGKSRAAAANLNIGITKRIVWPLWLYAGAGGSYAKTLQEVKGYSGEKQRDVQGTIVRYDSERWRPNVDGGIIVVLRPITLSVGARYDFDQVFISAGFGFSIFP